MTTNTKHPIYRTIRDLLSACEDLDMQLEEIEDSARQARESREELVNTLQDLKSISRVLAAASQLAVYETDLATYIHEHRSSMDYRTERMFDQLFNIVRLAPATFA